MGAFTISSFVLYSVRIASAVAPYLLEKGLAKKDEILLLSYSRASAEDLENKINKVAQGLTVETFHALGLKILTESSGKKKAIEEQLRAYITQFFEEELERNPEIANEIFQYIALCRYRIIFLPTYLMFFPD